MKKTTHTMSCLFHAIQYVLTRSILQNNWRVSCKPPKQATVSEFNDGEISEFLETSDSSVHSVQRCTGCLQGRFGRFYSSNTL